MSRSKSLSLAGIVLASAMVLGWTSSANAQCQNGMCQMARSAPMVASQPAIVAATSYFGDYTTVANSAPMPINGTANFVEYSTNYVWPSSLNTCAGSTCCGATCGTYYAPVQNWSVPYEVYYPTSTYAPRAPTCAGGTCHLH